MKNYFTEKTKLSVYKSTFSPILSFASETWVLNKKHKSKIQTMEMRFLQKVVGKTRHDKIRNEQLEEIWECHHYK
jgi:hypothetical protein